MLLRLTGPLGLLGLALLWMVSTAAAPTSSVTAQFHPAIQTAARPAAGVQPASGGEVGYVPCDVYRAYGLNASGLNGAGRTIAIVDVNDQPSIQSDLHGFDAAFGLPDPPSFGRYQPFGAVPVDGGWGTEITLDVEWAHAAAPGAAIALVEVPTSSISNPRSGSDLVAGVGYAVNTLNADVVSMSWTMPESVMTSVFGDSGEAALNAQAFPATNGAGHAVTYLAAAGDAGAETNWPAVAATVVGVGGTSLAPAAYGYAGYPGTHYNCSGASPSAGVDSSNETAWGNQNCTSGPPASCSGTGGGPSSFDTKPSWQSIAPGSYRTSPDVAMLADPATGTATFQNGAWNQFLVGGTSLATPLWAGVVAALDEQRSLRGQAGLALSSSAAWTYSASASDFNDIVSGSSPPAPGVACVAAGTCTAGTGYDPLTGRGSPRFGALLADGAVAGTGPGSYRLSYDPLAPVRILDTRTGLGGHAGQLANGATVSLQVGGLNGVPSTAGAAAVNVGVTNTGSAAAGYVLLYPCGQPRPLASTVNFSRNQTIAVLTQTQLSSGCLNVYMNTAGGTGAADVFIDLQGYFGTAASGLGLYRPLSTPVRALDSRIGLGTSRAAFGSGEARRLQVAGNPAIASSPAIAASAQSVVLNLTAVDGTAASYLSAYPAPAAGAACPADLTTSNVNFPAGRVQANRVTVTVGGSGGICLYNSAGTADVLVDVAGWYSGGQAGDATGAMYTPFQPTRIFDSRLGTPVGPGANGCPSGGDRAVVIPPAAGVAAALNVTALDVAASTYVQVYPAGSPSATSDINLLPGDVMPNLVVATLGANATVDLCNSVSTADVLLDLNGGYS